MRYVTTLMLVGSLCFPHPVIAKRAANRPYVASMPYSPFYARCMPDETEGSKGITQILCVRKEGDTLLHEYKWYNKSGLHLGWSPIAGKVAVMRFRQTAGKDLDTHAEISFYLGGKLLKCYRVLDLMRLGVHKNQYRMDSQPRLEYTPIECKQVPNTNDYYFGIDLGKGKVLRFNVMTGNLCKLVEEKKTTVNASGGKSIRTNYSLIEVEQDAEQAVAPAASEAAPRIGAASEAGER